MYRVRQTTLAQCTATIRILIEVQNHLDPLYFVHIKFEKTIFNFMKNLWRSGGRFWKFVICKGSLCNTSFERFLYPHYYGIKSFQLLSSIYVQGTPKCKILGLPRLLHCVVTLHRRIIKVLPKLLKTYNKMGYGHIPAHFVI